MIEKETPAKKYDKGGNIQQGELYYISYLAT